MLAKIRTAGLLAVASLLMAGSAFGQITAIEGNVKDADGNPVKDAKILIERTDMKGVYKGAKTDKKGHYIYNGLPLGTYKVSVEIDGKTVDFVGNVHTSLGDPKPINFDMKASKQEQQALQQAVNTGTLSKEQERSLSKEQIAAIEKQKKEAEKVNAHNKALNDTFNAGMQAMQAKDYQAAADQFTKAGEVDPTQVAVWTNMASAYTELAKTKKGDPPAQQAALDKAVEAYNKALAIKPDSGSIHQNLGLALVAMNKLPEGKAELMKAADMDPAVADKAYFNLGAVLVNAHDNDGAVEAFKKATELNPSNAEAQFQYGNALSGKLTTTADGKVVAPPGMKEALQKYLELEPDGKNAEAAKGLLTAIGQTIETNYANPNAKKAPPPKKK